MSDKTDQTYCCPKCKSESISYSKEDWQWRCHDCLCLFTIDEDIRNENLKKLMELGLELDTKFGVIRCKTCGNVIQLCTCYKEVKQMESA